MAKKRELEAKLDAGLIHLGPTETVGVYLERWLEDSARASLSIRTYPGYEANIERYLKPSIGAVRLDKLNGQQIQSVYQGMQERGLSPRTVRYAHAVLHAALEQAVRWRMLQHNPSDGVRLPKQERQEMQTLSSAEAARLLQVSAGTP